MLFFLAKESNASIKCIWTLIFLLRLFSFSFQYVSIFASYSWPVQRQHGGGELIFFVIYEWIVVGCGIFLLYTLIEMNPNVCRMKSTIIMQLVVFKFVHIRKYGFNYGNFLKKCFEDYHTKEITRIEAIIVYFLQIFYTKLLFLYEVYLKVVNSIMKIILYWFITYIQNIHSPLRFWRKAWNWRISWRIWRTT